MIDITAPNFFSLYDLNRLKFLERWSGFETVEKTPRTQNKQLRTEVRRLLRMPGLLWLWDRRLMFELSIGLNNIKRQLLEQVPSRQASNAKGMMRKEVARTSRETQTGHVCTGRTMVPGANVHIEATVAGVRSDTRISSEGWFRSLYHKQTGGA